MLAILDLKILLEKRKDKHGYTLDVPDHLILQFDNCSENKVSRGVCMQCYVRCMFKRYHVNSNILL